MSKQFDRQGKSPYAYYASAVEERRPEMSNRAAERSGVEEQRRPERSRSGRRSVERSKAGTAERRLAAGRWSRAWRFLVAGRQMRNGEEERRIELKKKRRTAGELGRRNERGDCLSFD
ncbi:unnamed protein product [Linum trigynum]|uniref:Uncharacterized protein n=1 Tax=Linum trigynum TaxID=586398 RepID=A0AAV2FWM7_9ROSI